MINDVGQISEREREILRLVATGATNQQIAHQLNISVNTVKVHLRNIFGKIGVASRTEATMYAVRAGLVEVPGAVAEPEPPAVESAAPDPAPPDPPDPPQQLQPVLAAASAEVIAAPRAAPTRRSRALLLGGLGVAVALLIAVIVLVLERVNQPMNVTPSAVPNAEAQGARWKPRAPLPEARSRFALAGYDGRLYAIGGALNGAAVATVARYDPENNVWASLDDKPTAVSNVQAVTLGGRIYVPGGEGADGKALAVFEAYDPRSNQWETLPALPAPRSRYALAAVEGKIYLLGGWDGSKIQGNVFIYDPTTREWANGTPMKTPRRDAGAATVDGRIYVIGGEDAQGASRANDRYDPSAPSGGAWESLVPLPGAIADPGVVPLSTFALAVFDPQRRIVLQYSPSKDIWSSVQVPENVGISSRATAYGASTFLFGNGNPASLTEYQSIFTTFIPGLSSSP